GRPRPRAGPARGRACRRSGPGGARSRRRSPSRRRRGCRTRGRWRDSVEDLHVVTLAQVVREPVLEPLLERLVVQRVADLLLHLVDGLVARADALVDAQEVEAAPGAHRLAHLARLRREGRLLELAPHLAAADAAELPPPAGPGALRELLGERREVLP